MKTAWMKRGAAALLSLTVAGMLTLPAAAAPLERDPVKGYATKVPGKSEAGVLTYQDFETDKKDEDGRIGKFSATEPDDTSIPPATIEIVNNVAHSGSKSLKVSARGKNPDGSPMGYNTITYKDIGIDIAEKFVKDPANSKKTDTYFVSAWVRNVDPSVTQYFWLQLQYGGSGEVWLPGQTYFEVKGDQWTQIGIAVVNGKTYYVPFIEDTTKSGIYAPRNGVSTWSALKFITKNPKANPTDANEKIVQTNNDFYVDDIVIWKVDDAAQLVKELPQEGGEPTTAKTTAKKTTPTKKPTGSAQTEAPVTPGNTTATNAAGETTATAEATEASGNATVAETTTASTAPTGQEEQPGGLGAGAIAGIVAAAVVVLGGGGFALYWFKFRKA